MNGGRGRRRQQRIRACALSAALWQHLSPLVLLLLCLAPCFVCGAGGADAGGVTETQTTAAAATTTPSDESTERVIEADSIEMPSTIVDGRKRDDGKRSVHENSFVFRWPPAACFSATHAVRILLTWRDSLACSDS